MTIKIKIKSEEEPGSKLNFSLIARKTMDGRIFILDHPDIDIAILPNEKKVVTFPKEEMNDYVYGTQNLFFNFLTKKGVILPESIHGGNIYGSLEAMIPETTDDIDPIRMVMMVTAKFIENEKEHFQFEDDYYKLQKERYVNPSDEDSTELGEVPHEERKGAITPGSRPYNYGGAFGPSY
tara:strand:- start:228 stop:767 length:540 start_codon:yes stop_codon:yes gene_type:complete